MKKIVLLVFFISINIISIFSIPKPKSNNVGALVGKVYVSLEDDWKTNWGGEMRSGEYYKGILYLKNNETGKEYVINSTLDGLFYLLNLPTGNYTIVRFYYKYETGGGWFKIPSKLAIPIEILPMKITTLKTIIIKRSLLLVDEKKHKKDANETIQPMTQSVIRKDDVEEVKGLFQKIDRRNLWGSFEWNIINE